MVSAALDDVATEAGRAKAPPVLPGGAPVLGHMRDMQRDPLALLTRVRDELGDVGMVRIGTRKVIVVSDPAGVERILVDNVKNYTKQTRGYEQLRKMLGNGLVTSEGSFWLRQRRITQPAFHREKLAGLAQIIQRDTDEAIARYPRGAPFDLNLEMTQLTMRIIGEALFSVDVSGDSDVAGVAINELVHQALARTLGISAPMFVPTQANRRFRAAKRTLDGLVYAIIAARRAGEDKPDLLSTLMHVVDEETGERMNDEQLRDEVLTLFAAGHETTSMLVSWTLHALLDEPAVLQKLQEEIDAAPLTVERAMRMPYLDAVLKESLRLHPPVWMVARCAAEEDVIGGYRIPKGHMLFAPQWTVHRHPKLWADPLRFDPARFLVEDAARPKYAYFPFLGGPRKCIGDQLALLEGKIILASLLKAFTFARVPGHPVVADPAVTLRMKQGLWVNATAR